MSQSKLMVAEFNSATHLLKGAKETTRAGYTNFETYSPFPIHGMDKAMNLGQSHLGWLALIGGLLGCATGVLLQEWAAQVAYPLVISGKPLGSHAAFVPVIFELTILLTGFFTVFGMFALNKLPQLYNIIFNHSTFYTASSHGFFLSIDANDTQFNEETTKKHLQQIGGSNIEIVKDEE